MELGRLKLSMKRRMYRCASITEICTLAVLSMVKTVHTLKQVDIIRYN
jgi:hypothetical protein